MTPSSWSSGVRTQGCAARPAGSATSQATGCGLPRCPGWSPASLAPTPPPGAGAPSVGSRGGQTSLDGGPDSADHSGVQSMHDGKVLRRPEGHDSETVEEEELALGN